MFHTLEFFMIVIMPQPNSMTRHLANDLESTRNSHGKHSSLADTRRIYLKQLEKFLCTCKKTSLQWWFYQKSGEQTDRHTRTPLETDWRKRRWRNRPTQRWKDRDIEYHLDLVWLNICNRISSKKWPRFPK